MSISKDTIQLDESEIRGLRLSNDDFDPMKVDVSKEFNYFQERMEKVLGQFQDD